MEATAMQSDKNNEQMVMTYPQFILFDQSIHKKEISSSQDVMKPVHTRKTKKSDGFNYTCQSISKSACSRIEVWTHVRDKKYSKHC